MRLRLVDERALVAFRGGVITAGLQVVVNPIGGGRAADEIEAVFVEIEENGVADHVAVMAAGDELLGLIHLEILESVYAEVGE